MHFEQLEEAYPYWSALVAGLSISPGHLGDSESLRSCLLHINLLMHSASWAGAAGTLP